MFTKNISKPVSGGNPHQKAHRTGFTLIELLVVISIIALLIAITLPALSKARAKASSVVCATRLKGMGTAMAAYLSEYNNSFPINGILFPKGNASDIGTLPLAYQTPIPNKFADSRPLGPQYWRLEYGALWTSMNGLAPDPNTTPPLPPPSPAMLKAFLCPSDPLSRTYVPPAGSTTIPLTFQPMAGGLVQVVQGSQAQGGYWSYSVNAILNSLGRFRDNFAGPLPWIDPMKGSTIENPSAFIYFIEEADDSLMNDEVFDAPAFGGGDFITNRHNNGGNLGYGDGHVEPVSEVAFDNGGKNPSTTTPYLAMQSPWTRFFFPDNGAFAAGP